MQISDSHCSAGTTRFEPVQSLLFQMDSSGVDRAVLVVGVSVGSPTTQPNLLHIRGSLRTWNLQIDATVPTLTRDTAFKRKVRPSRRLLLSEKR